MAGATKVCAECGVEHPLSDFQRIYMGGDGDWREQRAEWKTSGVCWLCMGANADMRQEAEDIVTAARLNREYERRDYTKHSSGAGGE